MCSPQSFSASRASVTNWCRLVRTDDPARLPLTVPQDSLDRLKAHAQALHPSGAGPAQVVEPPPWHHPFAGLVASRPMRASSAALPFEVAVRVRARAVRGEQLRAGGPVRQAVDDRPGRRRQMDQSSLGALAALGRQPDAVGRQLVSCGPRKSQSGAPQSGSTGARQLRRARPCHPAPRHTSTSSPSSSVRARRFSVAAFSTCCAGLASIMSRAAAQLRNRFTAASVLLAANGRPAISDAVDELDHVTLPDRRQGPVAPQGQNFALHPARTSSTVRLSAWSRLIHSAHGRAHTVLGHHTRLLPDRFSALAPAGSRPAATSPNRRLASVLAVSTVHGDPNGPMVTLRSGAARPLPGAVQEDEAAGALGADPQPEALHAAVPERPTAPAHASCGR